ncbi:MAG: D-alanyl-D-alanine carboxypeptidase [Gammaproteobacteria bacterium]|nr:D-alanyl-D-alanine carboxypeptidase [Gammaproteobacteria bacterium]MBU1482951.1 D-alanyl-D-alanine carboxypeptidase [Gammaproteobacteria bacterium]
MRSLLFIGLWLLAPSAPAASQPDPFPQVATAYLVELDGNTIWARHPERRLPPASLTKLMTALLVLEQKHLEDEVTVKASATRETGSRIGLKSGQRFYMQDLLAAALLPSANDACHALADHLAGNETAFVARMNQRAQALGMHNTHFTNACGHDKPGHYSSAKDLNILAHALLEYPSLTGITSQGKLQIATLDGKHHYTLESKNALIGRYDGALGIKTGYTPKAGKCLVAYARRGNNTVLLVMLHGNDRWWDAVDILELAFDHALQTP